MKKLGIYSFYDKDGIVDRYVPYFLNEVRQYLDFLIVVVNGKLNPEGEKKLLNYANNVIIRENIGYDAMAVRSIMVDYYNWVGLYQYDCVVVMNDTFFGPFYSMKDIFRKVEEGADLWGIQARIAGEVQNSKVTTVNSFFYSMSRNLLQKASWKKFWINMEADKWSFLEVLEKYENNLVSECEKAGCTWDAYLRSDKMSYLRKESSCADYWNLGFELIKYYQYPFLKRKPFSWTLDFSHSDSSTLKRALKFIDEETNYDISMIWENILRIYNILDIKNALQLTRIFDEKKENKYTGIDLSSCAIILKTEQREWVEDYIQNIKAFEEMQFYIFTSDRFIYDNLSEKLPASNLNVQIKYDVLPYQYLSSVLEISQEYDFVMYIDDRDMVYENSRIVTGRTCQNLIYECMWKSENYIQKIIREFREQKCLGVGVLPQMFHGKYMNGFKNSWGNYFQKISETVASIGVYIPLDEKKDCINSWPVFWTRGPILERACRAVTSQSIHSFELISAILGRLLPYAAQAMGYYTEEFLNTQSAEIYYSNLEYLVRNILDREVNNGNTISEYKDFKYMGIRRFCQCNKKVYIYGAGYWGGQVLQKLKELMVDNVIGFIVTDGHRKMDRLEGYQIYELHEVRECEDMGVIVAIRANQQSEIVENLCKEGIRNIFTI